jgi:hypothetical protein
MSHAAKISVALTPELAAMVGQAVESQRWVKGFAWAGKTTKSRNKPLSIPGSEMAVDDPPTDRAFRIGQKRNIPAPQFVRQGPVQEKVGGMIETQRALFDELPGGSAAKKRTEMKD